MKNGTNIKFCNKISSPGDWKTANKLTDQTLILKEQNEPSFEKWSKDQSKKARSHIKLSDLNQDNCFRETN